MRKFELGEIRYAHFPLEEDNSKYIDRPVIIIIAQNPDILVVKLTKTSPRKNDPFDIPIKNYRSAGLKFPSTARISKTVTLDESQLFGKVGNLHPHDLEVVIEKLIELSNQ